MKNTICSIEKPRKRNHVLVNGYLLEIVEIICPFCLAPTNVVEDMNSNVCSSCHNKIRMEDLNNEIL